MGPSRDENRVLNFENESFIMKQLPLTYLKTDEILILSFVYFP